MINNDFDALLRIIQTGIYGEDIRGAIHSALEYLNTHTPGGDRIITSDSVTSIEMCSLIEYQSMESHDEETLYLVYGEGIDESKINIIILDDNGNRTTTIYKYSAISGAYNKLQELDLDESEPKCELYIGRNAGITSLPLDCFTQISCMNKLYLPPSIETVGIRAFYGCNGIKTVNAEWSISTLPEDVFKCENMEVLNLAEGLEIIESYSIGSLVIETITLPNSVERLEEHVFDRCSSLSELNIGSGIQYIHPNALGGLGASTSITININTSENYILGAPWGAQNATVNWLG